MFNQGHHDLTNTTYYEDVERKMAITNTSSGSGMFTFNNSLAGMVSTSATADTNTCPEGWKTITSLSSSSTRYGSSEVHVPPFLGHKVWLADMVSLDCGRHHWDVFMKTYPDIEIIVLGIGSELASMVTTNTKAFLREEDYMVFKTWFDEKIATFGSLENLYGNYFPPPPSKLTSSIYVQMPTHNNASDLACWMEKNCIAPIYAIADTLVFTNEDDAMLFKMKYSGVDNKLIIE